MLSPFQGGLPRKPVRADRTGPGAASVSFKAGKPTPVDADRPTAVARTGPGAGEVRWAQGAPDPLPLPAPVRVERFGTDKVRVVYADGAPDVVGIDGVAAAAGGRTDPRHVEVALSDGNVVSAAIRGGGGWLLTDPNVSLADEALRLDGTIAPAP